MSLVMYTGDLKPDLEVTCTADAAVNLTTASSVRIIGKRNDTIVFDATPDSVIVVDDTTQVKRLWQAGDTAIAGRIQVEVEATWPGNKKQTFRADGGVDVRRDFDAEALDAADPPPLETVVSDASVAAVLDLHGDSYDLVASLVDSAVEDAVAAHTPGIELGFAERTSNFTTTSVGLGSFIPGMTITVIGQGRPVDIVFYAPSVRHTVASTTVALYLDVNGSATVTESQVAQMSTPSTTTGKTLILRRRAILTNAVSYTFKVGVFAFAAGTSTLTGSTAAAMEFSVTSR